MKQGYNARLDESLEQNTEKNLNLIKQEETKAKLCQRKCTKHAYGGDQLWHTNLMVRKVVKQHLSGLIKSNGKAKPIMIKKKSGKFTDWAKKNMLANQFAQHLLL